MRMPYRRCARTMERWRRTRPFYAGLLMLAGSIALVGLSWSGIGFLPFAGPSGAAAWVIGAMLAVSGLTTWADGSRRYFTGALAIVLALCSLVAVNLGGLLLGFLLAATGGCLALSWAPHSR